ncbi:MAG: right-handed parallel beta-helix repeat-containing protein [Nitrososphaeria archaeon]
MGKVKMKRNISDVMLVLFLVSALMIVNINQVKGWAGTVSPYNLHERMTRDAFEGLVEAGLWRAEDIGNIPEHSNEVDEVLPHCKLSCHRVTQYQKVFESYGGDICEFAGAEWEASYYISMARKSYVAGKMDEFHKYLGYAIHYIQDAACPPHVFPFQEGVGNAHFDFEEYTAREYDNKNWKQLIKNAPINTITNIRDLLTKVNDTANWVNATFQPPRVSYVRQDGVSIGILPEGWDWFMTDEDIGEIMQRIAGLVKGAALYAIGERIETIYIRSNGSIDPPDAPIETYDNVTYILTGNITSSADGIIVERDNITLEGAGYTLKSIGSAGTKGVILNGRHNVTIKNLRILSFLHGIYLSDASDNLIVGNELKDNLNSGVWLTYGSSFNVISGNRMFGNYYGIAFEWSSFNTVAQNEINGSTVGILVYSSSDNIIFKNRISFNINGIVCNVQSRRNIIQCNDIVSNSGFGVEIENSHDHRIIGNSIRDNWAGIYLHESYNNTIYHNNIMHNSPHQVYIYQSTCVWDDGYPSGGNYWSDYQGSDSYKGFGQNQFGSDGIGDTPYSIDIDDVDSFPLFAQITIFDVGVWNGVAYHIDIVTKSTVLDLCFNPNEGPLFRFNVTGDDGTNGFCRVAIPKTLLWVEDGWTITVGDQPVTDYLELEDESFTYLHFTYNHSIQTITIRGTRVIPEFPLVTLTLMILILATLTTIWKAKRKH